MKKFILIFFLIQSFESLAQNPVLKYSPNDLNFAYLDSIKTRFSKVKLPEGYETQALLALSHYPELQNVKIKFKTKKRGAPFVSRPTVWSTFFKGRKKRTYLILIRTESDERFDPILMHNMPFNAQIGVLGHELGHTADFTQRKLGRLLQVTFGNLSWKYLDKFEFETDRRAIEHGLGYQLLAWSEHAIKTLRINEPAFSQTSEKSNSRERYMRPSTIIEEMKKLDIYKSSPVVLEKQN